MALVVTIYYLDKQGEDTVLGTLTWDGEQLTTNPPDSESLKNIATSRIWIDDRGPFTFKDDPEGFMRGLHKQYRSAYLRAGKAEEKDMRGEPHRQKSLLYEGKGIVEKPDKLGRRNCYDDQTGKRVSCPKKDGAKKEKPQTKPTRESVNTGETPTKEEAPVKDKLRSMDRRDLKDKLRSMDRRDLMDMAEQFIATVPGGFGAWRNRASTDDIVDLLLRKVPGGQLAREVEPTPEEVRKVHNPETGRKSAVDAIRDVNSGTMYGKIMRDELITEQELERASRRVHDAWMRREASLPGGGRASRRHLMVPYEQLSEADKEKDRVFVREVVASMRPEKYWGSKEQPFYRPGPNPTVDNVVMRDGESGPEVLLIRRKDGTAEGGKWALPGGFIDSDSKKGEPFKPGKETPEQAALRELTEESGLDLQSIQDQVKKVGTFDTRGRDPRDNAEAWAVSDAFSVKLPKDMADAYVQGRDDADRAEWVPVSELKNRELAFDHADILNASGVETPPEPGFTGTDRLGREWRDGELVAKQEEPVTDEEGYSQVDDATGKRRTPEEQQQYRRDIEEMNRQPREIAREAISGWDSFSPEERNSLRDVIDRHLEAIARNRKEEEVGRELTDDEVDDIKTDVFRQGLKRGRRDTQKLIRMIADPTQSGSTASEFKAALRKIRDSRAATQQQEPSKETPKPKVKPSPFKGRKKPS